MHRLLRIVAAAAVGLLFVPTAMAAQGYRTVTGPHPATDPNKVEVTEFFWYGCPHCYHFEPYIKRWLAQKPDDVEFRYVPAILGPSWELDARAYYAARVMGVLDRFHDAMFHAIHEEGQRFTQPGDLGKFVSTLGIDGDKFVATMKSFAVDTKIRRAKSLQRAYGISGTPSVVIDGQYVTSGALAGNFDRMIDIINDRVAAARGGSG